MLQGLIEAFKGEILDEMVLPVDSLLLLFADTCAGVLLWQIILHLCHFYDNWSGFHCYLPLCYKDTKTPLKMIEW